MKNNKINPEDPIDYSNVMVKKPWGEEYLIYQNEYVGIWHLHILKGSRTSMHCHPHKKTGLILLSGDAVLSFLNDSTPLKPVSKMMIREGLFHSTTAVSENGAFILEVESPCDKSDLVRLEDEYGREEKPYEGKNAFTPLSQDTVRFQKPTGSTPTTYQLHGCSLATEKITRIEQFKARAANELVVVLKGGLATKTGEPVLSAGDVVSSDTLQRLAERFYCPAESDILSIRKGQK